MPTPNIGVQQGLANTGIDNSLTFVRDVDPRMFYLESFKYPLVSSLFTMGTKLEKSSDGKYLLTGSNKFKQAKAQNMKIEWTENEMLKFAFNPTAAVTTGATTISISTSDDDYFVAGEEIMLVNAAGSREVARITAVAASTLTVTRNIGSTGAIALTTADFFYKMGVIRSEDSTSTSPRQTRSETLYNYLQFMSEPYGNSLIEQATANYHGDVYERSKSEAFARMKRNLEVMMWFGVRSLDDSTTNPVSHNGGILTFLESIFTDVPVVDAGGILTKSTWDAFLQEALKNGGMSKKIFCSSAVLSAVNGFATNNIRVMDQSMQRYGMTIQEYVGPFGSVQLVREPLFDEVTSTQGTAVCLDMDKVMWRFLEGNGTNLNLKSYEDRQENDRSGKKGEWMAVGGVQIATGKSHAILRNVQA
jgi:hypothetical protein